MQREDRIMLLFSLLSDGLFDECRNTTNDAAYQDNRQYMKPERTFSQHRLNGKRGDPYDYAQNYCFSFS